MILANSDSGCKFTLKKYRFYIDDSIFINNRVLKNFVRFNSQTGEGDFLEIRNKLFTFEIH